MARWKLEHDWIGRILIVNTETDEIAATMSKHAAGTPGSGIPVDTHAKLQTRRAEVMVAALNAEDVP